MQISTIYIIKQNNAINVATSKSHGADRIEKMSKVGKLCTYYR